MCKKCEQSGEAELGLGHFDSVHEVEDPEVRRQVVKLLGGRPFAADWPEAAAVNGPFRPPSFAYFNLNFSVRSSAADSCGFGRSDDVDCRMNESIVGWWRQLARRDVIPPTECGRRWRWCCVAFRFFRFREGKD